MSETGPEEPHRRPETSDFVYSGDVVGGNYSIAAPQPSSFLFHVNGGVDGLLLTINPDGEIVRGPAFTTEDEASLRFWDIIAKSFPGFLDNRDA